MNKHGSQEPGIVLHSFYVQLLLLNLVSFLIGKFDQKSNTHPRLAWTRPYMRRIRPKQEENVVL